MNDIQIALEYWKNYMSKRLEQHSPITGYEIHLQTAIDCLQEKSERENRICGNCKHAEETWNNPSDNLAPYYCHELEKQFSANYFCSYFEPKERGESNG